MNNLNPKALMWGSAVGIGVTVLTVAMGAFLPTIAPLLPAVPFTWTLRVLGLGGRFAAGFVAGSVARHDGLLHGLVVGVIVSVAGLLLVWTLTIVRFGNQMLTQMPASYWANTLIWSALGIATCTLGGWLGAQLRASSKP